MRKSILVLWMLICVIMTIACTKIEKGYVLKGEIKGLKDGTVLELTPVTLKSEKVLDSAVVRDGRFKFIGKLEEPRLFYLNVKGSNVGVRIMMENSMITMNAKFDKKNKYSFIDLRIKGSRVHELYKKKIAYRGILESKFAKFHKDSEDILSAINRAGENKKLADSLKNTNAYKAFTEAGKAFFECAEKTNMEVYMANKDSWWGPFLVVATMSYVTDEQIPLYEQFSEEAKNSYYGRLLKKELFPKRLVGSKAPSFELCDRNDKLFSSKDLMKGKKYVLIDFWASWCGPCRREIPNMKHLYKLYASKGLQIISISKDSSKKAWLKALDSEEMQWPNLLNDDGVDNKYFIRTIPAIFLVDANGIILDDKLRGESLSKKLKELFD